MNHTMAVKNLRFMVFCVFGLLLPSAVQAYTVHSEIINSETWDSGTHYVTANVTVNDNQVLMIMPGAIVKFAPNTQLTVYGTLNAQGTSPGDIIFTSKDDNTHGEIIDDSDSTPKNGDWCGIYLSGSGDNDGIGKFDYCLIRYGGNTDGSADANVYFSYSDSGHFLHSINEYSYYDGISIYDCSPEIVSN